jgi:hypothetical protein
MIPLACGIGLCLNNCPTHKGGVYLFPLTHKTEKKEQLKLKTPKTILRKPTRKNRDK